jgi:putative transposase
LETAKPAGANFLQQQARFDDFIEEFNTERPHQTLDMACLAERYNASSRSYRDLQELDYAFHDQTVTATTCGRVCYKRKKVNLSLVFAGQAVGIKQVEDHIWLASFTDYDLGYFDDETCKLEPSPNLFGAELLPMSQEQS